MVLLFIMHPNIVCDANLRIFFHSIIKMPKNLHPICMVHSFIVGIIGNYRAWPIWHLMDGKAPAHNILHSKEYRSNIGSRGNILYTLSKASPLLLSSEVADSQHKISKCLLNQRYPLPPQFIHFVEPWHILQRVVP